MRMQNFLSRNLPYLLCLMIVSCESVDDPEIEEYEEEFDLACLPEDDDADEVDLLEGDLAYEINFRDH